MAVSGFLLRVAGLFGSRSLRVNSVLIPPLTRTSAFSSNSWTLGMLPTRFAAGVWGVTFLGSATVVLTLYLFLPIHDLILR